MLRWQTGAGKAEWVWAEPGRAFNGHVLVSADGPVRYWQLGYVLSPARQWASFGTLDVSVQLPSGWSFASSPGLARSGDEARGSFQGVPADSLGMTAQFPYTVAPAISLPLIGIVIALGARSDRTLAGRVSGR